MPKSSTANARPTSAATARATKSSTRRRASRPAGTSGPFVTEDGAAALAHFREAALQRHAAGDVPHYNADLDVVPRNVARALEALGLHGDTASDDVRGRVLELPALTLALIVADGRVVDPLSDGSIAALQQAQRPMRASTLSYLESISTRGACELVPAERVAAIRANKGPIDEARDGISIVALFREFEATLRGKHPYTPAQLASFAANSVALLRVLAPDDAAALEGAAETSEETRVRDGLWALLIERYDELLVLAAQKWGVRKLYDFVPALNARSRAATRNTRDASDRGPGGASGDTKKPAK